MNAALAGYDFATRNSQEAPSTWDQVSDVVTGLPGGLLNLGGQVAQNVVAAPRLALDVARGDVSARDVLTHPGDVEQQYFPLTRGLRESFARTGYRVIHPQQYLEEASQGRIVPAAVEDVANASILLGPVSRVLGGAAGRTAAEVAGESAARAPLLARPSELAAEQVARPGVLRAAQAVERLTRPAEQVASAPARVWTAPLKLVKGVELPERLFGTTEEGAARTIGLKPLLDKTGLTQRIVESPTGRAVSEGIADWRARRAQTADVRENYLLPQSAELHVASNQLDKALAPARKILGGDAELEYANHLVRAGQEPNLRVLAGLRDTLDESRYNDLVARTFGREQGPSTRTVDLALDYIDGKLDPQVAARMDRAWEFERSAITDLEAMKLRGEGRGPLNPEQLGDAPMASRIDDRIGKLQERADQLRAEVEGRDVMGIHVPGLREEAAAARRLIPEPNMEQLVGQRAQGAARRAGALEAEQGLQGRLAERARVGAEQAGAREAQARLGTIEGARAQMARLQQERYGFAQYEPEWTATQRRAGEAERAAGPPAPRYTVPDDELALAQRIARLEGEGRTIPVERAAGRAQIAAARAGEAGQAGAAAGGRIFTGAAERRMPRPSGELPFGQAEPVHVMSEPEAHQYVAQVRREAKARIAERITEIDDRIRVAQQDAKVEIPNQAGSGEVGLWQQLVHELGRGIQNLRIHGERVFQSEEGRAPSGPLLPGEQRPVEQAPRARTQDLHEFLARFDPGEVNANGGLEAFVELIKARRALQDQQGAVLRDGMLDPGQIAVDQIEHAALAGTRAEAAANVRAVHSELLLPESEHGPSPWTMTRDDFKNELTGVQEQLGGLVGVPFEQWPDMAAQAERRLLELTPEIIDPLGLSADQLFDRIRGVAQSLGRPVPAEVAIFPAAAESAGRAAIDESRMMAQDALELDPLTREAARAQGREVRPDELIYNQLTADERKIYRQLAEEQKASGAQDMLAGARARLSEGLRAEGERAGQRVGEQAGAGRVYERQAETARQRAEALMPRAEAAGERTQQVAQEEAGRPLRFGERRGKLIRDVQVLERQLRTREGKLSWLEDERIPAEQVRLGLGPREVAPGKYVPALATGERLTSALQQMANALAEQTGDWTMGGMFWREMQDVPATMAELHAKGIYPEYLTGAIDEPTKGTPTIAGAQEQLPYEGPTPSMHRKGYGHVPQRIRTLQRSMVRELSAIMRNKTAVKLRDDFARPGHEILDELVHRGELEPSVAEGLRAASYDRSVDLAKEMERAGYSAWDPESPRGVVSDRQVTADSYFLPTPIAQEFQRWWKPTARNPFVRGYDRVTRSFKTGVLAMSPSWQVNNILGNAFMAVVFGGESPATIARLTREVLSAARAAGRELRTTTGETTGTGLREWSRDVAAGISQLDLPPRLFGAGQAAEITRQFAEHAEPRTPFGRAVNRSYAANEMIDNIGRSAVYLAKRGRGFSEEEAVGQALRAMGDFSNMTPFERDVVRRIVPFYAWMRHITQASLHLAVEHPWRTAWLLHVGAMFNDASMDPNLPDWLRGAVNAGGGWYVPFGGANPLQGNAGSIFTSPKDWPGEITRSLNPVIKLGAASVGVNLASGRPVTRPPGTGPVDQFGKPIWSWQTPNEIAYMGLRMLPQGRLFTDLVQQPVVRYDTGQPVKSLGHQIPLEGGKWALVAKDLNVPFFPVKVDEPAIRARIIKGRAALAKARAGYNR